MRIHFVAVSGTAMGSLAGLCAELGHDVSGSDVRFDPPIGPALKKWGIQLFEGFSADHLAHKPDLVVIGNVCRKDNVEARAAIDGGFRYTHVAGALQEFALEGTRPLVVAGTHGKTTTTSLCAYLLDAVGLEPGFLIGGIAKNFGTSFRTAPTTRSLPTLGEAGLSRPGGAKAFVLEGDEYDTAFFEKTAKFLHYHAQVLVLTSCEHDHIDIYPTEESYFAPFVQLLRDMPEDGLLIANANDAKVVELTRHARCRVSFYGTEDKKSYAPAIHWQGAIASSDASGTSFDLYGGGSYFGRVASPLSGHHNLQNVLAAFAAAAEGFGAKVDKLIEALARFEGIKRRQELIGTPGGVLVYDDFAHHPTAVRETLGGLKRRHPDGKLFAVFEPRSATACRALHQDAYPGSFSEADIVMLAPLGRSGLAPEEALELCKIDEQLAQSGTPASVMPDVDSIVAALKMQANAGDVVALLSNGAFGGIHSLVLNALADS